MFSAHGVPKSVPADATERNLFYLDATCPLVSKVHKQAMRHQKLGRHVVLIGHAGHPEVIGTMGQLPEGAVSLVETVEDAETYMPPDADNLGFVTQTTLSVDDTAGVIKRLHERFPNLTAPAADSICYATTNRQEAVKQAAPGCDHFIIVGAPNSSNSSAWSRSRCRPVRKNRFLSSASEIDWDDFADISTVGLSAGASAPEVIVNEIIEAFRERYDAAVELADTVEETENFLVNRELRHVPLTTQDMAFVSGD
ncbi:4-hydroxy-3-methylbut-2-enyl diphosphate reductase [Rhizobium sp. RCAM05350]|nr:4-hydroxy-3-methylbut-2-enyl diphosphate reductase [Rhizobium sp. RCAM05350]